MIRSAKALLLAVFLGSVCLAQSQSPAPAAPAPDNNRAGAYYNFAMGRLYAELAQSEGNRDYVNKAIEHYQAALKLDPSASIILEELTDIYLHTGRYADAVAQAEDLLKQNPDNLDARRMLGQIYLKRASDPQARKVDEEYLKKAIEQYQKITQKDPKDVESWVWLGRLYQFSNNSVEAEKAYNAALAADPGNEEALSDLAKLYSDLGDSNRAIEKLKAVTDKNPSPQSLIALSRAYRDLHDYKNAVDALQRALALVPDDERLRRELADDLVASGQFDDALKLYEQLAAADPHDYDPPLNMAKIYRAKKDFAKAEEALNKAKGLDAEAIDVRSEEVNLLQARGKTDEAIKVLKKTLDDTARRSYSPADTNNREALLFQMVNLCRSKGLYAQAIDALRQITTLDPGTAPRMAVEIVETYRAAKDYDSAMREADAAIQKYPDQRFLKIERAVVLSDTGKIDEAAGEVRAALKGQPDRQGSLQLAQIYEKGKRWTEMGQALDDAEKLATSDDDKENIYFMRGAMLERMKKYDASEAEFRKVLDLNPENAGALNYLGYMLADRDVRLDEAYQLIKKALDLEPDNGAYLDSMAWVYFRQGKLNEAETLLVKALEHMQDPTVHDHLGDVYFKLGKTKDAVAQWQASLKEFQTASQADSDPEEMAKVNRKLEGALARLARETKQKEQ